MKAIDLQGVVKRFRDVKAVADVTFDAAKGEIVALLGPSGCGKTTTLRLIAGFEKPDAGAILLNGRNVADKKPYERNVGLVFQDYALFPHLTVDQNVAFGLRERRVPRPEIARRCAEALTRVRLEALGGRRPGELSGGQQQRVALSRALAIAPDVLLLDEPLSNLDAKLREHLREELRGMLSGLEGASIIVTHDQDEAMGLADRIVLMNGGRVEQIDTPETLYARPRTRFAAEFIGRANWLTGTVRDRVGDAAVSVDTAPGPVIASAAAKFTPGERVSLCLRPERLRLADQASFGDGWSRWAGVVERVSVLGSDIFMTIATQEGPSLIAVRKNCGGPRPSVGDAVVLGFAPLDCVALAGDG